MTLAVVSLNEAGLRTLISKALLSWETSGVELPFLPAVLLLLQPRDTAVSARGELPASLLAICVCEQNSLHIKG